MQKQGIANHLNMFGDMACLTHHMGAVNDKRGRNITPQFLYGIDNIRLCSMVFCHRSRIKDYQAHAAGQMAGIQHRYVFKGLGSFHSVGVSPAGMLCHGDMDDVLGLCQSLSKKMFIVFHTGRLGGAVFP